MKDKKDYYLNDFYIHSRDPLLFEEGVKIIAFELENFIQAIEYAIESEFDFTNMYQSIDVLLNLEEKHDKRLFLSQRFLQQLESKKIRRKAFQEEFALMISYLGDIHYRLKNTNKAIDYYQRSIQKMEQFGFMESIPALYNNLGNVWADQNRLVESNAYYQKAIDLFQLLRGKVDNPHASLEIGHLQSYINLGQNLYLLDEYEAAISPLQQALQIAENINDPMNQAIAMHRLGMVESKRHHYEIAEAHYLRAAEIYQSFNHTYGVAEISQNLGALFSAQGEIEASIRAYKNSLESFILLEEDYSQAEIYNNLGALAYEQYRLEEAQDYYLRGLQLIEGQDIPKLEAMLFQGLGGIGMEWQDWETSLFYYQKALNTYQLLEYHAGVAEIYLNLSTLNFEKGEFALCREWAEKGLTYFQERDKP